MPASKKNSKRFLRPRWWQLILIAVAVGLSAWGAQAFFRHRHDQKLLRDDLTSSGIVLDTIADYIKTSVPGSTPHRFSRCYHASRKFEAEPIYCSQNILFARKDISEQQVKNELAEIDKILVEHSPLVFYKTIHNERSTSYHADTEHERGGCDIRTYKKINVTEKITGYEFNAECLSGDFDTLIYPDMSSEEYLSKLE